MNIAVAQSGGPTCAINASLLGLIKEAAACEKINAVYGAVNGIKGIIDDNIVNLTEETKNGEDIELLKQTPSTILGSCRFKLPDVSKDADIYKTIFSRFKQYGIEAFFYIGGNDSMDTTAKLSAYAKENGEDVRIIGIPKTIDNDLCETDHTPGFGSAAKYVATTLHEVIRDSAVYSVKYVTIVEIMGRNAGWLAASSCVLHTIGEAPHLIYLPETDFSTEQFIKDVNNLLEDHLSVVVAVSEGINLKTDAETTYKTDAFGHSGPQGVGKQLEKLVAEKIGCKVRSIELNVMQRCASHISSLTDINEAEEIGAAAVKEMLKGTTGKMMCFNRISDNPYKTQIFCADACLVANHEKNFPEKWINEQRNNVTDEAINYFLPLIQGEQTIKTENGLPVHYRIFNNI